MDQTSTVLPKVKITIPTCIALSFILNFLLEIILRRSLWYTLSFVCTHPLRFLIGVGIILFFVLISQLVRRQIFYLTIIYIIWIILGAVNAVLLSVRSTPLSASDMIMVKYALTIWNVYFQPWQIVLICVGIAALIAGCVFLYRRGPRLSRRLRVRPAICLMSALLVVLLGGNALGLGVTDLESSDMEGTYYDYGFAYCFSQSFIDQKMTEPTEYNEKNVMAFKELLPDQASGSGTPNIIFLQLESWLDLSRVSGLELSENPAPNYTALRESCSGGLLTVSTIGGGTINTEFEILTGLSMNYLGLGAYPFETIVEGTTIDSLAYAFKQLGYTATAIHNHQGTFYDRNIGYSNLGFDEFDSLEFMPVSETNINGWAKDSMLIDEILDTLSSSDGPDYIHTVSIQTHGSYPTDAPEEPYPIQVNSQMEETDKYAVEFYASQMAEVDDFIGQLIDVLSELDEDVILILYGDHLPAIESLYELDEGDRYQTEYVVWSNMNLEVEHKDIATYQLGAYVQSRLGMSVGIMPRYHQSMYGKKNYSTGSSLLVYDLLYGEGYAYGDEGRPEATDMILGRHHPEVKRLTQTVSGLEIKGENFNTFSRVYVDGKEIMTTYLSDEIIVADIILEEGQEVTVSQVSGNGAILYTTDSYTLADKQIPQKESRRSILNK